jgi:F-type H+-transporting ATPase subunit b
MAFLNDPLNWVFISFVIFAGLFFKFGWASVLAKLDGRISEIRAELATAETLRADAEKMLAEYQQKHRDAMKEAAEIANRAKAQSEAMAVKAEADLRETIARREKQLTERLARIEASAEAEMRKATAAIAMAASEALIKKSLDAKGQAALADKAIAGLSAAAIN